MGVCMHPVCYCVHLVLGPLLLDTYKDDSLYAGGWMETEFLTLSQKLQFS